MQLICSGKTKRCPPNFQFPLTFQIIKTENHRSNQTKAIKPFESYFSISGKIKSVKSRCCLLLPWIRLQDKITTKWENFMLKNSCEIVIIPHNLTNGFQPLEISVNKVAKCFTSEKHNYWLANEVSKQLRAGKAAGLLMKCRSSWGGCRC